MQKLLTFSSIIFEELVYFHWRESLCHQYEELYKKFWLVVLTFISFLKHKLRVIHMEVSSTSILVINWFSTAPPSLPSPTTDGQETSEAGHDHFRKQAV